MSIEKLAQFKNHVNYRKFKNATGADNKLPWTLIPL